MGRERRREDEIGRVLQRLRDGDEGLKGQYIKGTIDGRVVTKGRLPLVYALDIDGLDITSIDDRIPVGAIRPSYHRPLWNQPSSSLPSSSLNLRASMAGTCQIRLLVPGVALLGSSSAGGVEAGDCVESRARRASRWSGIGLVVLESGTVSIMW